MMMEKEKDGRLKSENGCQGRLKRMEGRLIVHNFSIDESNVWNGKN
jgi:hypothetical protein